MEEPGRAVIGLVVGFGLLLAGGAAADQYVMDFENERTADKHFSFFGAAATRTPFCPK